MKYRYTSPIPGADPASKRRVPLVKATLLSQDNKRVTVLAMVDSGADICVFNLGYAVALGIDLRTCEQVVVSGVEGVARDCYKTTIDLGVEGLPKITVAVLFIDSSGVDGLLGQEGFFDQHIVTFNRHNDSFEVVPNLG
jgi:Aspartyl protease